MRTFRPGDKVRLITGGPEMAVESVRTNPTLVYCVWFEGDKLQHRQFTPDVLEPWEDYEARSRQQVDQWSRESNDYDPLGRT